MRPITLKKILKKFNSVDRILIIICVIGFIIAVVCLFRGILKDNHVQVEYLTNGQLTSDGSTNILLVDIEGGVINSGVYTLSEGSRIKDVLILAGGLSNDADREFCEKNINMAELIKDGQKIYIPKKTNTDTSSPYNEAKAIGNTISINSSSIADLDTLWGIGTARAEAIVKNRPYQKLEDLVTKGVLTQNLLERNREKISLN